LRNTRRKRLIKNNRRESLKFKAVLLVAVLIFTITLNSFQNFIQESNASSCDDGYRNISVNWSRTKEYNTQGGKVVDTTNYNGNYWSSNFNINGTKYKFLNKNNSNQIGVLKTDRILRSTENILLDYNTLLGDNGILKPTETTNVWDGKLGIKRYFDHYSQDPAVDEPNYPDYATWTHFGAQNNVQDQWRAFRGTFSDNELGIKDSSGNYDPNKRVYVGVKNKDPQLILPVNDYVIILVDGQVTKMNFSTEPVSERNNLNFYTENHNGQRTIQKVEFQPLYYNQNWPGQNQKYKCNDPSHAANSIHTDTWHAHLDSKITQNDGGNFRLGDITNYLNPNITNHKIEIIGGDFCEGGGMSKLQLYMTETPDTEVTKSGYIIKDGNEVEINDNDPNSNLYFSDTVYYKFKIQNKKDMNLPNANIIFEDTTLGIKVCKDGIFKKNLDTGNYEKVSSQNLIVKKNNSTILKDAQALDALATLNANESIEVSCTDYIKHQITDDDLKNGKFINTVVGTVSYFNEGLTLSHQAKFTVIPKYPSLYETKMVKSVDKVVRNNQVIYNAQGTSELPDLIPNDIVTFKIQIINTGTRATGFMVLEDILEGGSYSINSWSFTYNNKPFDPKGFRLLAGESKDITTEWTVKTPVKGNINDYNPINTAYLKLGDEVIKSELKLSLSRPKLKIIKNLDKDSLAESDINKTFTISVTGDNNTTYNFEAALGKEYLLDNLEYGVKYTITELIPMNYQSIENKLVVMDAQTNNSVIELDNKKVNDEHFYDDDTVTNSFLYSKPQ
jgi:hypothetical protein